ncbi:MAG: DNA polymerase III subunit beta [Lachnospiraceae bacterium]
MKFICSKAALQSAVSIVSKAVPSRTTMPILECILIKASEGILKLTANNMELGIETIVSGCLIEEDGQIALDAKIFSELVRRLPDNEVTLTSERSGAVSIVCEKAKFAIQGQAGDDFVFLPDIKRETGVALSQFTLKEIIRQTIFSTADSESNSMMSGELLEINENELRLVSLDGHRISIRKIYLKEVYEPISCVIPGKTLSEVSKILAGDMERQVFLFFTQNHVVFEFDNTIVVSRLLEGKYFRIDQMLRGGYETKVTVNKRELLSCIDRATLLIKESDKKPIVINITDEHMAIRLNSSIGSLDEDIAIEKKGRDILIGFNPRFLMDALKVIDDEIITLYTVNAKAPCFIKDDKESYIYLILPVNFNV